MCLCFTVLQIDGGITDPQERIYSDGDITDLLLDDRILRSDGTQLDGQRCYPSIKPNILCIE